MAKDTKVLIAAIGFTFLAIIGFAFLLGGKQEDQEASYSEIQGVEISPQPSDWGDISINGGEVIKEFELTNSLDTKVKVKNIATTCMCTEAKIKVGENETRFFGMEHPGDRNPPVNLEIGPGEAAKITVKFDPAAHGPEGIGPFERIVVLTFTDPIGIKELKFSGTVVSE